MYYLHNYHNYLHNYAHYLILPSPGIGVTVPRSPPGRLGTFAGPNGNAMGRERGRRRLWPGTFVLSVFFLIIIVVVFLLLCSHFCFIFKTYSLNFLDPTVCGVSRWSSALPHSTQEMRKVRRSHTKSRRGCLQCKNGHVKVS